MGGGRGGRKGVFHNITDRASDVPAYTCISCDTSEILHSRLGD